MINRFHNRGASAPASAAKGILELFAPAVDCVTVEAEVFGG